MAKRKEREKTLKLRCYNIVIQPVESQDKENYTKLFKKFFELNPPVCVYGDRYMRFKSMNFSEDGLIYGTLVNFVQLSGEDWYNSETNDYENVNVNPSLHPNVKEYNYYFSPSKHKLYIEIGVAVKQADKFLTTLISQATQALGYDAVCNVVSSQESIERIISAKRLTRLVIRIHYSNSDNPDGWAGMIDNDNKESNIRTLKVEATGTKGNPIELENNNMMLGCLSLSRVNGDAIATVVTDNGTEHISTQDSPEQTEVKYRNQDCILDKVKHLFGLK